MKPRSAITSIVIVLALLFLFSALPAGADHTITRSDSTCGYNGASIADFDYEGVYQDGDWIFEWDTVPHTKSVKMQANGGGIFTVWTTVNPSNLWDSTFGYTTFKMTALSQVAGQTMYFRLAVNCQGNTPRQGAFDHTPTAETSKD